MLPANSSLKTNKTGSTFMKWVIIILSALYLAPTGSAFHFLSESEYNRISYLLGQKGSANKEGSIIISSIAHLDHLNMAKDMLENPSNSPEFDNRILILSGKLAKDIQSLFTAFGMAVTHIKDDFVVISGKSAEIILKEFIDTGLILQETLSNTKENLLLLGGNTITHAGLIISNLIMTGAMESLAFLVIVADNLWTIGHILYARAGNLLLEASESNILIVKYMALGILKILRITRWAFSIIMKAIKVISQVTRQAINGTQRAFKIAIENTTVTRKKSFLRTITNTLFNHH
jgi:hypothetical protein